MIGRVHVFERVVDYETAGSNALAFIRFYNSRANLVPVTTFSTIFGTNWRSNYDRYLRNKSNSPDFVTISAERDDGRVVDFNLTGSTWVPDSDIDLTLVQAGSNWILTDSDDTVETYASGASNKDPALLTSIRLRNGYTQTLSYNANNQLVSVTDSYGHKLTLTYNGNLLQSATTPDGLVLTYGYDESGSTPGTADRLASVSYSTTPATKQTYLYENGSLPFAMTGIIDEKGQRYNTWTYDTYSRGLSSQLGVGVGLTTIAYDDADGSRTVTNALGQQQLYKFATVVGAPKVVEIDRLTSATVPAATRTITYDANGYVASRTDWNGNLTTYANDPHGQPLMVTEAVGSPAQRVTTTTFHPTFHLPATIVTDGLAVNLTYDDAGELLTRTENDTGKNGGSRFWSYGWTNGLLASITDPRGSVTGFTYDASGALTAITNPLGQLTRISSHLPGGLPRVVVDPNGVTTRLNYTARQWLHTQTVSTAGGDRVTTYSYDPTGSVVRIARPGGEAMNGAYDDAHRSIRLTDLAGARIAYELDVLDGRTETATFGKGDTKAAGRQTATYDVLGRVLTNDIGAMDAVTHFTYDGNGNALTATDPLHRVTTREFDALDRPTQTTDPAGASTKFTYDTHGRTTTVIDANGNTTSYSYDGFGDLVQQVSPDTGATQYQYDLSGNLTLKTDNAGTITAYSYDALNRQTAKTYPSDPTENITFHYDQAGQGFGVGRLTSITDAAGALAFTYDEQGNTLTETRDAGGASFVTAYSYDADSRVAAVTYPSGLVVTYVRDVMERVAGITAQAPGGSAMPLASKIGYEPFGPVNALQFGNGMTETREYDLAYRQIRLATAGAASVQDLTYHYDLAGNLRTIADAITPGESQSFIYNDTDRLTEAKGAYGNLGYRYDAVGNRTKEVVTGIGGTTSYSYAPHSNRLTSITGGGATQTLGYSSAGNIATATTSGNVTQYAYNAAERLKQVTIHGQGVAEYTYDAFGHRFSLAPSGLAGSKILYLYGQQGDLLEEASDAGVPGRDYIYLDGQPIAFLTPQDGRVYYLHSDRLGTPQAVTDGSQAVEWQANYEPFGKTSVTTAKITQNLRFPGQYEDTALGWYQNGFRDYAPAWGRYLESDPIGLAGGLNTFAYAGSRPTLDFDPLGLWQITVYGGIGLGGELTFGYNGGQVNIGAFGGVGVGFGFQIDPNDEGCHASGINPGVAARLDAEFRNAEEGDEAAAEIEVAYFPGNPDDSYANASLTLGDFSGGVEDREGHLEVGELGEVTHPISGVSRQPGGAFAGGAGSFAGIGAIKYFGVHRPAPPSVDRTGPSVPIW